MTSMIEKHVNCKKIASSSKVRPFQCAITIASPKYAPCQSGFSSAAWNYTCSGQMFVPSESVVELLEKQEC